MKHIPSLFDDPEAEAAADARAEADLREGRSISHGAMTRWLTSWDRASVCPSRLPATELRIEWTPEAADNLDAIVTYVELFHPPAAERLAIRMIALAAVKIIVLSP